MTEVLHYATFTTSPSGGNGAGVILDASALEAEQMVTIGRAPSPGRVRELAGKLTS